MIDTNRNLLDDNGYMDNITRLAISACPSIIVRVEYPALIVSEKTLSCRSVKLECYGTYEDVIDRIGEYISLRYPDSVVYVMGIYQRKNGYVFRFAEINKSEIV